MFDLSIGIRFLIFIVGLALGFAFILKSLFFVNTIGKSAWAEQNIPGGTYGAVKLFGIFLIIVSVIVLFNF
jgi:hypothetical protein